MDVTSMLNSASAAARREAREQSNPTPTPSVVDGTTVCSSIIQTPSPERTPLRRASESRTPNRARTPWDAGGYSLPLTLDTKTATQPSAKPAFYNESPVDSGSPRSPKHKPSDSYSSLSSCNSSLNSVSHSRFSSVSTVSGFQSFGPLITDLPALESRSSDTLDSAISRSSMSDFFGKRSRKDGGVSPTIAEEPCPGDARRPGSPSDAMLISRGSQGLDRMSPQEFNNSDSRSAQSFLALPDLAKAHKRAVSAPDFAAVNGIDQNYSSTQQTLQPTPPPSHQGDRRASYMMESLSASPTAPAAASSEEGIQCMYVDNCDTGSQPRKAISHIFGRNKLCTRMIPQPVWVHFCRKHYQRSRYRNAQEYSKLQCELVQKQLERVHSWSEANKTAGSSGVVQDWSLSIRKREQKRLDEQNHASGKKRRFRAEHDDDDDDVDTAALSGTAVPTWLLEKCNSGYTTAEMQEIVAQLKGEIDSGKLPQIPDIEILPNIITDATDDNKARAPIKRKTSAGSGAHKRSQSVGYTQSARLDVTPMMRRISQPGVSDWSADAMYASPYEKRQRTATLSLSPYSTADRQAHRGSLSQVPERAVPLMGHAQQAVLTHRPASYSYGNIRENPVEEALYDNAGARSSPYAMGGPLPTPVTQQQQQQRISQPMMPQQPDNQAYFESNRRPMHQRTQSEMGLFQHNPNFSFRAPVDYTAAPQGYPTEAMSYEAYQAYSNGPPPYYGEGASLNRAAYNSQGVWAPSPESHGSPYNTMPPRHGRHQSTSAVPQAIPRVAQTEDIYGPLHGSPNRFAGHPVQHRRQFSYGSSQSNSVDNQRVHETSQWELLMYRDRR